MLKEQNKSRVAAVMAIHLLTISKQNTLVHF